MLRLQECRNAVETAGDVEEVDASVCVQMPLFASAEAEKGWLGTHPGSRVLPVRDVWDESGLRELRDRMSALLDLTN